MTLLEQSHQSEQLFEDLTKTEFGKSPLSREKYNLSQEIEAGGSNNIVDKITKVHTIKLPSFFLLALVGLRLVVLVES